MAAHVLPTLAGFIVTVISIPFLIRLANKTGVVDNPSHRKTHTRPTPYLGGVGIILGFMLAAAASWAVLGRWGGEDLNRIGTILLPALLAGLLGVCDDIFVVRARIKLLVQLGIALSFALMAPTIDVINIPAYGKIELNDLGIPFTVLWMVALINGVNLVDGIDGLAASVTAVMFGAIGLLGYQLNDGLISMLGMGGLGASLGFLIFNWRPAKIYMGDAGSLALGTLLCTLLLSLGRKGMPHFPLDEPFPYQFASITLIAFYPFMEITLTVLRRLLAGKPVGSADKGHIHHRLLKWDWSPQMVCGIAVFLSMIAAFTVVAGRLHYHGVAAGLLMVEGLSFGLLMHFCGFLEMLHPQSIKHNRPHFLIANHFIGMQRIKLDLAENVGEIAALVEQTCVEFGVESFLIQIENAGPVAPPALRWTKPASAHASLLLPAESAGEPVGKAFSDKFVAKSGSRAAWTFEVSASEAEIDVEYHVLMSEFMHKALQRVEQLCPDTAEPMARLDNTQETAVRGMSSKTLSKRRSPSGRMLKADSIRAATSRRERSKPD